MRWRTITGTALFVAILLIVVFMLVVTFTTTMDTDPIFLVPIALGAGVGLLLSIRVPDNNMGLVISIASVALAGLGASGVAQEWALDRDYLGFAVFSSLIHDTSWVVLILSVLVLLPIWFPDGRAISRWSSWAARIALVTAVVPFVGFWLSDEVCVLWPEADCLRYAANPWGIDDWDGAAIESLLIVTVLMVIPAVVSAVMRWRRSVGVERQQLKWFALAYVLMVAGFATSFDVIELSQEANDLFTAAALSAVWLSIGRAVLKYRLYEIDRVISRTVGYVLVVGVLGSVYVVGAVWLPSQLVGEDVPALFVAGSTLAVAALFNPVRKLVVGWVDRRFHRSRYDADRVVEEFGLRLRDQVDVSRLADDLEAVVGQTLQPSVVGIWVKDR